MVREGGNVTVCWQYSRERGNEQIRSYPTLSLSLSLTPLCIDSRFHTQTLVSDFKPQNANLSLPLPLLTDAPPPTTSHDDEYSTTPAPTKTLVGVVFFVHRSRRRWWRRRPLLTDTPLPPPPTPSDADPAPTTTPGGVVFFAPCWWRR